MGSPVSVTVANLVVEDVEERALVSFPYPLPFWKRYVDDSCMRSPPVWSTSCNVTSTVWSLSIQFTYEVEEDGRLLYLDVLLHHANGSLMTSIYCKPSHTDKYLDFHSNHLPSQKLVVVQSLQSQAATDPSSRGPPPTHPRLRPWPKR